MPLTFHTILLFLAFLCFVVVACNGSFTRVNLSGLGLALVTLSMLLR